jgi:hypothetical protein
LGESSKKPRGTETAKRVVLRRLTRREGTVGGVKENVQDEFKEAQQD